MCCFQAEVTLRKLWASGYQVIASYEHSTERRHTELWPDIPYWWANKCKAEALIDEFERMKQQNRRPGDLLTSHDVRQVRIKHIHHLDLTVCVCVCFRRFLCDGD